MINKIMNLEKLKKTKLAELIKGLKRKAYRRRWLWKVSFDSNVDFVSVSDTFDHLFENLKARKKTVFLRFGDGEINLINDRKHRDQNNSKYLIKELKDTFSLKGKGVIKGLPIHSDKFGKEAFMEEGVHWRRDKDAVSLLSGCFEYFIGSRIYSSVPVHYLMVHERGLVLEYFKELKSHNPVFVGGEHNDATIIEKVVGASEILKVSARHAYKDIDRIEKDLRKIIDSRSSDFHVVIFSCGVLAKALSKRLWLSNDLGTLYLFDLGSVIDVFHGRDEWTWVRKAEIDKVYIESFIEQVN